MSETERFIKFIPSEEAIYLLTQKGHAFRLLTIIATIARRYEGSPDGLKIGEAFIGGHENYDMSEQNYRTAKDILIRRQHLEIVETCRTRKKVTTGVTTVGTKVKLISSNVYDLNLSLDNDRSNDRPTTDQRPTNDKLRKIKKDKKDKKEQPQTPSSSFQEKINFREHVRLTQTEFDSLLAKHGKDFLDRMLDSLDSYKGSNGKEYKSDFHTMKEGGWVVERIKKEMVTSKSSTQKESGLNELLGKKLEQKYSNYIKGWRCYIYNDTKKDQKGLLFESESPYLTPHFIAFSNGRFKEEVANFLKLKNLGDI